MEHSVEISGVVLGLDWAEKDVQLAYQPVAAERLRRRLFKVRFPLMIRCSLIIESLSRPNGILC